MASSFEMSSPPRALPPNFHICVDMLMGPKGRKVTMAANEGEWYKVQHTFYDDWCNIGLLSK